MKAVSKTTTFLRRKGLLAMPNDSKSYVHGGCDIPLMGLTVDQLFDATARAFADNVALIVRHQGIRWTYSELQARVDDMAAGLVALGLEPGDRLGIWAPNCFEWVVTQFATAKAGIIRFPSG